MNKKYISNNKKRNTITVKQHILFLILKHKIIIKIVEVTSIIVQIKRYTKLNERHLVIG